MTFPYNLSSPEELDIGYDLEIKITKLYRLSTICAQFLKADQVEYLGYQHTDMSFFSVTSFQIAEHCLNIIAVSN